MSDPFHLLLAGRSIGQMWGLHTCMMSKWNQQQLDRKAEGQADSLTPSHHVFSGASC